MNKCIVCATEKSDHETLCCCADCARIWKRFLSQVEAYGRTDHATIDRLRSKGRDARLSNWGETLQRIKKDPFGNYPELFPIAEGQGKGDYPLDEFFLVAAWGEAKRKCIETMEKKREKKLAQIKTSN